MAPTTAKATKYVLLRLVKAHDGRPVAELDDATVSAFLALYKGGAPSSQRRVISCAGTFTRWLARQHLIPVDPFRDVDKPRLPRYMPRALGAEQVAAIFDACADRYETLMVSLMVNEALRCVEVSRLQVGDVNMRERVLRVIGKGGHERVLPITDETYSILVAYFDELGLVAGPLIVNKRWPDRQEGLSAAWVSAVVTRVMREAGVKRKRHDRVSPHALRHTAATDMLRNGAHVRDVQAILGHANLKNTETYMPLVVGDLRAAMGGRGYRFPEVAKAKRRVGSE
jgi:integrase/recombinase XerD